MSTGGYFADVTHCGSATQVTAVDITLPADAGNSATLEIRIMSVNATGNDEWVGIDDISCSSPPITGGAETQTVLRSDVVTQAEGDSGTTIFTFTVSRTGGTTGQVNFSGGVTYGITDAADFGRRGRRLQRLDPATARPADLHDHVQGDDIVEANETFTLLIDCVTNAAADVTDVIGANASATGNITNDDDARHRCRSTTSPWRRAIAAPPPSPSPSCAAAATTARSARLDAQPARRRRPRRRHRLRPAPLATGTVSFADGETSQTITVARPGRHHLRADTRPSASRSPRRPAAPPSAMRHGHGHDHQRRCGPGRHAQHRRRQPRRGQ